MKDWITLPSSDLSKRENWQNPESDRYIAFRVRILINKTRINDAHVSPIIEQYEIAPNDTHTLNWRRQQMVSQDTTIQESIRLSLTKRVFNKLSSTLSTEFAMQAPGFTGKFNSSLVASDEREIIEGIEDTLSGTESFTFQEVKEETQIIEMKGAEKVRVAQLRHVLWPHRWDVYLHSLEYLELQHRSHLWGWFQTRKTIKKIPTTIVKIPLFRISFYQPQANPSVFYSNSFKEIPDPSGIEVVRLDDSPPSGSPPSDDSLDDLAKSAFPISEEERKTAARKKAAKKTKRPSAKRAANKPSAKRTAKGKAVARKATAKRAIKKPSAKRAAKRKAVARKATAKKAIKKPSAKRTAKTRAVAKKATAKKAVRKPSAKRAAAKRRQIRRRA